jgi:hypothetical protein
LFYNKADTNRWKNIYRMNIIKKISRNRKASLDIYRKYKLSTYKNRNQN